jgi:hypothetical protein
MANPFFIGAVQGYNQGQDRVTAQQLAALQQQIEQQNLSRMQNRDQGDVLYAQALQALAQQQAQPTPGPGVSSQPMAMPQPQQPSQGVPVNLQGQGLAGNIPPINSSQLMGPQQGGAMPRQTQGGLPAMPSYSQPQQGQGKLTWQQIFSAIQKANPSASPGAVAAAVGNFSQVMTDQSKQDYEQQMKYLTMEDQDRRQDARDAALMDRTQLMVSGANARNANTVSGANARSDNTIAAASDRLNRALAAKQAGQISDQQFKTIQDAAKIEAGLQEAGIRGGTPQTMDAGNAAAANVASGQGAGIPTFTSPDDPGYQALPSGRQYKDPAGNIRTKP